MEEVNFFYSPESYQRSNGTVSDFGELFIKINSFYFPEQHWTDFGCKAVYIWSEDFINLLNGNELKAECNFYDGSFLFNLEKINDKSWEITFVDEDGDKEFERKFFVDPAQISTELLNALEFMKEIRFKQNNEKSVAFYEERERELKTAIEALKQANFT